jgi:formate hydrogenlyase transcriptional activator
VQSDTLQSLADYPWPGNVRELENIIERAMIVTAGEQLEVEPRWLESVGADVTDGKESGALSEMERQAIVDALNRCHGRVYGPNGAAAALGLRPTTLYGKMRKYHISKHPSTDGSA